MRESKQRQLRRPHTAPQVLSWRSLLYFFGCRTVAIFRVRRAAKNILPVDARHILLVSPQDGQTERLGISAERVRVEQRGCADSQLSTPRSCFREAEARMDTPYFVDFPTILLPGLAGMGQS